MQEKPPAFSNITKNGGRKTEEIEFKTIDIV